MKNVFKFILLAAFLLVNSVSCDLLKDDEDDDEGVGSVSDYSNQLADLSTVNQSFVEATHDFLSANLNDLSVSEVSSIMDEFIKTGEDFVATLEAIENFQKNSSGGYAEKSASAVCTVYDVVPTLDNGVGVGLVKSVGDIIGEAKGDIKNLDKMLESGEIDENEYKDAADELRQKKLLKAGGLTIGAITGTGAAIVTGAVIGVATLPAIATVAVVGGVVGGTVTWFANWYSGANKSAIADESNMYLISGKTTNGGIIPLNHLKSGMNLTLVPQGMAPVTITNFELPESGINRTIEFEPKDLKNASKEEGYEVCFIDETMAASSCSDVMFVNAYPSPANPDPGQNVTVYASITPPIGGCSISFSIVGTDGYSDSETASTNSQGQASFGIPGAVSKTVDVVTITTSNGKTYTVSYVF